MKKSIKSSKSSKNEMLNVTVSNVSVDDKKIIITGSNLSSVTKFEIKNKNGISDNGFSIFFKSPNKLIVERTLSNISFAAGKALDFILSNAHAAYPFSINFTLCDATFAGKPFDCFAPDATDKQVLSLVNGKWTPRSINGLNYIGAWNPSSNGGDGPNIEDAGSYYIISSSAVMNPGAFGVGSVALNVGDWIVSDGLNWQKIDNSTVITTVFSRTGNIVAMEGDYDLNKLADVTINTPALGQVLKFNACSYPMGLNG